MYGQSTDLVVLYTSQGPLVIEFFPEDAPNHVANFIELSRSGFYDNTAFHRIISGFMIQGGDPHTKPDSGVGQDRWGMGGPGTTIDAEFNDIMHNRGIVSMARSSDPNSAGSQFFIVHQDSNFLDASYTVFGRLATAESYETLDAIAGIEVDVIDRPVSPDLVRIFFAQVLTRDQVVNVQDMDPSMRIQSGFEESSSGEEYTSEVYNFSIKFPEGWVVQNIDSEGGPNLAAVSSSDAPIPPSIAVYIEEANGHTIDTVRESKLADVEAMGDSLQIVNHELTTINNFDIFVLDATGIFDIGTGPFDIGYSEVTIVSSGKIYTLLFSATLRDYDSGVRLFSESLESFDILERSDHTVDDYTVPDFVRISQFFFLGLNVNSDLREQFGGVSIYSVASGSMVPVLDVGDLIVSSPLETFEDVAVGDIIVFNRPSDHDRVIVHRVDSVLNDNPYTLRAKGDANPASIPGTDSPITEDEYIGNVVKILEYHQSIDTGDNPVLGSVSTPVEIIMFTNFQCLECKQFHDDVLPLLETRYVDSGLAHVVYRDFLDNHPNVITAAVASHCAHEQGAYWNYSDRLFERMSSWRSLDSVVQTFQAYATGLGLDSSAFSQCLRTGTYTSEVVGDHAEGISYGIHEPGVLFVGSESTGYYELSGDTSYEVIRNVVDAVLFANLVP